jgi:hypothetical protein
VLAGSRAVRHDQRRGAAAFSGLIHEGRGGARLPSNVELT